ncbi:universal stress protein [Dyadobacter psychrophilus]|uniref:Nucleotide-binding universal stress protein, UspA family n=1 Tax=Dyadobacter psychrophilus TaxID=651661 RepID=A0A1T5B7J9_9BACT|nr:universal stress protein [Dyadobacter psychrophilus]SKB43242.1 Nucleotide-binding universal stress protein, UspA family [Dyadobacter psychrophilus]
MKTILVPCDFSKAARQAVEFAKEIALVSPGEIKVLHVVEPEYLYGNGMAGQPYVFNDPVLPISVFIQDAEHEFENMKTALGDATVKITLVVERGPLIETVLNVAERENADLIVMSSTGAKGLREFFIGSNSERIVRRAPIPVFVTHQTQHVNDIRDIIVPTSMDLTENEFLTEVKKLQAFFGAILHVLYINNYPMSLVHDQQATASLQSYANFYNLERYTLNVRRGANLEKGILDFASKMPGSIIAMSTHGYKGFEHLLKGSVAEGVVNHTTGTVFTYANPQN